MLITKQEYYDMGFSAEDENLLENCIKRAEFVINGLTSGRALVVVSMGGERADYIKQATAFQTKHIYRSEMNNRETSDTEERYTIGDFSYSSKSSTSEGEDYFDTTNTIIRLLRASGCLFGGLRI